MTLHLPPVLLRQMLDHCHAEHPLEAGGILPGRGDRPEWHLPLRNVSDNPARRYAPDADEQLVAYRAMDEAGEDPIVVYHSHTASPSEPSEMDRSIWLAAYRAMEEAEEDPAEHYVIVSTHDAPGEWPRVRSWRYQDGSLMEEPIISAARCG